MGFPHPHRDLIEDQFPLSLLAPRKWVSIVLCFPFIGPFIRQGTGASIYVPILFELWIVAPALLLHHSPEKSQVFLGWGWELG